MKIGLLPVFPILTAVMLCALGVPDADGAEGGEGPAPGSLSMVITEFVASNDQGIQDEDGDSSDWVEFYNAGDIAVSLEGWALTDDPLDPDQWVFSDVVVESGAFLVVFASGKDRKPVNGDNLHTNFRLSQEGEYLALSNSEGQLQSLSSFEPEFPRQVKDFSFGLHPERDGLWYFDTPTPGAPNGGGNAYQWTEELWTPGGAVPPYVWVFNRDEVEDYEIVIEKADWESLQEKPTEYVSGTLKVRGKTFDNVAIRYKGDSSFFKWPEGSPKKPFRIDFNRFVSGQSYYGIKKLNFGNSWRDPSQMREVLAYEAFAVAESPAGRASHVNFYVTVPNVYDRELFGVYVMVEHVDKTFLAQRFGDNSGNLYKAGSPEATLEWLGPDPELYDRDYRYEKSTNEEENDWSDFIRFLDVLNNTPAEQFRTEIEKVFNVEGFLKTLAANTALSNMDSIAGRNANYYLYHNPSTGLFEFIPWDLNLAFGSFGNRSDDLIALDIYKPVLQRGEHILIDRILNEPEYAGRYALKILKLVEDYFNPENLNPRIDEIYALIQPHVYADIHKEFSDEKFDQSVERDVRYGPEESRWVFGLKPFVADRSVNILKPGFPI